MHKLITFAAASALLALTGLPAAATVNKTWVSSTGADSGSCQLVAPCKTFAYAISQTAAGGEIDVKDSGAFGGFTINKAISIIADGVVASVGVADNGAGIEIDGSNFTTLIHGLSVDTHDTSHTNAIYITCSCHVVLDHDILQGGYSGVNFNSPGYVQLTNSLLTGNYRGIYSYSGTIYVGTNNITGNTYGVAGNIYSYGNNEINGNTTCDTCNAYIVNAPFQ